MSLVLLLLLPHHPERWSFSTVTPSSGANPFLMSERPARKWPDLRCALAGEGVTLEGCSRRRVLLKNRLLVTTGAPGAPRGMRVGGRAASARQPLRHGESRRLSSRTSCNQALLLSLTHEKVVLKGISGPILQLSCFLIKHGPLLSYKP